MKSPLSTRKFLDTTMSVDGWTLSDPWMNMMDVDEFFVRICPSICGTPLHVRKKSWKEGFLPDDQRFFLKSIQVEEDGFARLHYSRVKKGIQN
jgi:hypothetical protein